MVEVLSKTNLFSPTYCSSVSSSLKNSSSSSSSLKVQPLKSSFNSDFHGRKIVLQQFEKEPRKGKFQALPIQMSLCIGKAQKWWQKGLQPNMKEITSAQDLVDSLLNAGDKLVIVDFFSSGCGGCKALHPKICQFAELNPDVQFLQVNYEEHKSMSYSLNVHVLPFFRFYRGAHGRLCSFSCTNATIKKFKDALAKHTTERCSLGPPRGLEESELLALAANKDLSFNYTPKPKPAAEPVPIPAQGQRPDPEPTPATIKFPLPSTSKAIIKNSEEKTLITSGR
ncbi:Thioredoxin [Macleaya cordata]|uniref:Thioredoxin n=1 Tax=Macleaya cordata TaxID=56857 RepID=A0A200QR59_MACCD|nr:Thioredoxin [Macleaya cordata]